MNETAVLPAPEYMDVFLSNLTTHVIAMSKKTGGLLIDRLLEAVAATFTSERALFMMKNGEPEWRVRSSFRETRENLGVWGQGAVRGSPLLGRCLETQRGVASDREDDIGEQLRNIGIVSAAAVPVLCEGAVRGLLIVCNRSLDGIPFGVLLTTYEGEIMKVLWQKVISPPLADLLGSTTALDDVLVHDKVLVPIVNCYVHMFETIPQAKIRTVLSASRLQLASIEKCRDAPFEQEDRFELFKGCLRELWQDIKLLSAPTHMQSNQETNRFLDSLKQIVALLIGCLKGMEAAELDGHKLDAVRCAIDKLSSAVLSDLDVQEVVDALLSADFDIDRPLRGAKDHLERGD